MPKSLTRTVNTPCIPVLLILLFCHAACGPAFGQDDVDEAAGYYEQAVDDFNNQDYKSAFIQVKNVLRVNPNNSAARTLLGQVHLEMKDAKSAERELKIALQMGEDENLVKPFLAKALLYQHKYKEIIETLSADGLANQAKLEILIVRGEAYLAMNKTKEAETSFGESVRLAPNTAAPHLALARMYIQSNQLDLAEDHSALAVSLDPKNPDSWQLKAELRRIKNDLTGALESYDEVLRLDPGYDDARIGRAAALIDLKRDAAALQIIDEILRETPNHTAALYLKVIIVARVKDLEGGQALIEDISRTLGKMNLVFIENHPPSTLLIGVTRFAEGNFDEARIHLKRAIQMIPKNTLVRKLYAKILLQDKNFEAAVAVLEPALKLTPKDPYLLTLLGNAYLQERRFVEASHIFETAISLTPGQAIHVTGLAISYLGRGQESKATQQLESIVAADSKEIKAGKLLAFLYIRQEKYDESIKTVNRLLAVEDTDATLHNLAGVGYLKQGDLSAARTSFDRALKHAPLFIPARANLAKMDWEEGNSALAASRYRKILDQNPDNIGAKLQLSAIAESENRLQEAISWLEKIDLPDDQLISDKARLIELNLKLKKPEVALSIAERLSYLDPTNFAVLIGLAKSQLALGKTERAIGTLRTTAVLSAESAPKLVEVAKLQLAIKDIEHTAKSLHQALKTSPNFLPAIAAMTTLALMEDKYDEALFWANQAQIQNLESARGDILAGDVFMRMGRFNAAFRAYQQARKKENNSAIAARIYQADKVLHGEKQAFMSLEHWIKSHPHHQAGQLILAKAYLQAGEFGKARKFYEMLLKKQPRNPDLLNGLAWIYQQQGDPRALSYAEMAYDAAPDQVSVLDTLGWVLVQKGEPERALKYLREAVGRGSNEPVVGYHIGVALHRLGRNDEASLQLKKTLKLSDEFDGAKDAKVLLKQLMN